MNEPKISIVTPMYNCEEYIVDCINSVLYQNFKDIEHIIIDDCSTDKSAEIASNIIEQHRGGEINFKLLRHEKNTGQGEAINDGIAVARGKYIRVLHADDVFMPNALENLYNIAEQTGADVVHEPAKLISMSDNGATIKPGCQLRVDVHDHHPVNNVLMMSTDLNDRVADWFERGTHVDIMYNLFRRDFLIDNDIRFDECGGNFLFTFYWLMTAKTVVKVPQATYIYRAGNPTSVTNINQSFDYVERVIDSIVECNRCLDKFMSRIEFFSDKKWLRELIKIEAASINDSHSLRRRGFYHHGMTPELYEVVERAMKKHFGEDGWIAAFFFHVAHEIPRGRLLENERLFRDQTKARYIIYRTAD